MLISFGEWFSVTQTFSTGGREYIPRALSWRLIIGVWLLKLLKLMGGSKALQNTGGGGRREIHFSTHLSGHNTQGKFKTAAHSLAGEKGAIPFSNL